MLLLLRFRVIGHVYNVLYTLVLYIISKLYVITEVALLTISDTISDAEVHSAFQLKKTLSCS